MSLKCSTGREEHLPPNERRSLKPIVYSCLAIVACIFGWHIFLWSQAPKIADVKVNPLTDVVYVSVPDVTSESGLSSAFVSSFKGARDLVGGAIGDKELENKVRENFDVYAMALPYHIIFKDKKVEQPPVTVARRSVPEPDPQPEAPVAPRSGEYSNSRFGYTIAIPPGFVAGDEPTNGDGIRYTSADGQATLTMVGSNTGGTTIKQYYDDLSTGIGAQPSYSRMADDWFVLSGTKGDNIFYIKTFVGVASENNFTFEYPADQADRYRWVNDQLVRTFKHGDLDKAW